MTFTYEGGWGVNLQQFPLPPGLGAGDTITQHTVRVTQQQRNELTSSQQKQHLSSPEMLGMRKAVVLGFHVLPLHRRPLGISHALNQQEEGGGTPLLPTISQSGCKESCCTRRNVMGWPKVIESHSHTAHPSPLGAKVSASQDGVPIATNLATLGTIRILSLPTA